MMHYCYLGFDGQLINGSAKERYRVPLVAVSLIVNSWDKSLPLVACHALLLSLTVSRSRKISMARVARRQFSAPAHFPRSALSLAY